MKKELINRISLSVQTYMPDIIGLSKVLNVRESHP